MKNITFEEIFKFIDRTAIPKVKAAYVYKNQNQKRKIALGAMDFIFQFGEHSSANPMMGKFKHKIYFAPHGEAIKRLSQKETFIEYILHFLTQTYGDNKDLRTFDSSKTKAINLIGKVIKGADGFYETKYGFNYYKLRKEKKESYAILVLKSTSIEGVEKFRVAGYMPSRTPAYLVSKKTAALGISTPKAMITEEPAETD